MECRGRLPAQAGSPAEQTLRQGREFLWEVVPRSIWEGGRQPGREEKEEYSTGCSSEQGTAVDDKGLRPPGDTRKAVQNVPLSGQEAGTFVHSLPSLTDGGLLLGSPPSWHS